MVLTGCDHVDKVLAFLSIGGEIEQVAAAVMKESERGCRGTKAH